MSSISCLNTEATGHVWLFKFKLIKIKFSFSVALATFQVPSGHTVAAGYCIARCRRRVCPALQKVLWDSTGLAARQVVLGGCWC